MATTSSSNNTHLLPPFLRQSKADIHAKFIDLEWQQRNRLLQGTQPPTSPSTPPSQWSRLAGEAVTARNRYLNVEPFATNRIKLKVAPGVSDYINASPIQLGPRKYIATQGPKDTSVNHFYRMLVHEVAEPVVVVMLTQTHEAGREKCFQYYPLSAEESPLVIPPDEEIDDGFEGEVELERVEWQSSSRSELRRLRLKTTEPGRGDERVVQEKGIRHLLFSGWPDFLIPEGEDREALVELVRLSERLNTPSHPTTSNTTNSDPSATNGTPSSSTPHSEHEETDQQNPRIIHCSAGVGRSGTFIALDYLLHLLDSGALDGMGDRDPIAETVDVLRQQRMMMVQGESQFYFLYEVMREQYLLKLGKTKEGGDGVGALP